MYNKLLATLGGGLLLLNACTKSTATIYLNDPLDTSWFKGVNSVTSNNDGTYQISWGMLPNNLVIASTAEYGIFSREVPETNLWGKFLNLFSNKNDYDFATPLAKVSYKKGSYTTPMLAFKNNTCFVVRVVGAKDFKDQNVVEICTGHTKYTFAGVKAVTVNSDSSYNVSWDKIPYVSSLYNVFMRDEVSGSYNFSTPAIVINGNTSWQSEILSYRPSQCFVVRAAPIGGEFVDTNTTEICTKHTQTFYAGIASLTALGGGSYKIEWPQGILPNTTYKIFEREALGQYNIQLPLLTSSELNYTKTNVTGNYCYLVRAVSAVSAFTDTNVKELCVSQQIYGNFAGITNSTIVGNDVQLGVEWATGATAMRVLRDGTVISTQTQAQNFTYTDSNAASATEHLYQAQAIINGEALAGTAAHTVSNANVGDFIGCGSVVALSDTQIQVNYAWPVIEGHTVSAITIYRNGILVSTQTSPSSNNYVDSGFTAQEAARYTCKIVIDDVEITGKQSLATTTLTSEATPTAVPTVAVEATPTVAPTAVPTQAPAPNVGGLLGVPTSDTVIGLTWNSGGGSTLSYVASYASGATAPATCNDGIALTAGQISGIPQGFPSVTTASITGLTTVTQYSFRVCAVNGNAIPDVSSGATVTVTTLQIAPPNPSGLSATASSDTVIGLSWATGGGTTAAYRISYATGATAPATCAAGTVFSAGQAGTTASITGLAATTQYSFRVCSINSNGTPDISSGIIASATTVQAAPPDVTGLSATVSSDTVIGLSWTSGGGSTTAYKVSYASGATPPATCAAGAVFSTGQAGTTASITGLTANTQYSFRVCAVNSNATPDVASGTTATGTTIKAAPTDLSGTGGTGLVTLSWSTVSGATNYALYYSTSPSVTKAATRVEVAAPSYQVTSLATSTTYYFNIAVIVGSVESNLSGNETSATTLEVTAPTVGTAISFASVTGTTLTANWGVASDNVTAAASLQYKLVMATASASIDTISEADAIAGGNLLLNWTANTLTKVVTGLSGSTTYYFAVVVKDTAGNKALYTPVSQATTNDYTSATIGILKYVPAGTFQRDATPTNLSTVSAFRMSQYEITRAQFSTIMGSDPSNVTYSTGTTDPVQMVNWYHAIAFCNKLSLLEGFTPVYSVTGVDFSTIAYASIPIVTNANWNAATANWSANGYRLPTEMEWMWAAMGGSDSGGTGYLKAFAGSTGVNVIDNYAWYNQNSLGITHPAGTKLANELGLYDMSGNVSERNWDWYAAYPDGSLTDYRGAASSICCRVLPGGSWEYSFFSSQVAYRSFADPAYEDYNYGFRVVRP